MPVKHALIISWKCESQSVYAYRCIRLGSFQMDNFVARSRKALHKAYGAFLDESVFIRILYIM